ncbi:hypothetical protein Misp01_34800 [Microtetraspora sp. NBRC 13810]|uniref:Clp protease N-terminal domain-containing protein n=1 Tax=Microtetraspora sp. NBRC 13810 TaxID=3030990 RepID=UPI0024A372F3|nr:Clp protease N-terminal domain-containing protein [Microtetraspora sp. NBRC 13810]GLW08350.1 hypothetical protein Misp01_34800 [Microtetraspora sp. NBRC 13810]
MFERFTEPARRVVVLAQEEARRLGHGHIGTEHILLGLAGEEGGLAAGILRGWGLDRDRLRGEVERVVPRGRAGTAEHMPFTPRCKKVLELALREAILLQHQHIGTEHILLGLIREGEGAATQALARTGLTVKTLRDRVLAEIRSRTPERTPSVRHFAADPASLGERLERLQRGLDRIERRLDLLGAPPDPGPAPTPGPGSPPGPGPAPSPAPDPGRGPGRGPDPGPAPDAEPGEPGEGAEGGGRA